MEENVRELLGVRVRELRKIKKLTQEGLAEKIGIEPNNMCRIENCKNFPTPENLAKIAFALGVRVYELFQYEHLENSESLKAILLEAIAKDDELANTMFKFYKTVR